MGVKHYRGIDMREALQKIRQDLGEDAVILSTRQVRGEGLRFFGRSLWEVSARAGSEDDVGVDFEGMAEKMGQIELDMEGKVDSAAVLPERDLAMEGLRSEVSQLRKMLRNSRDGEGLNGQAMRQLRHELIDMRQAVEALQHKRLGEGLELPDTLVGLHQHLVFHGMEEKFARRLIEQTAERIAPEKREDFTYVEIFLARMLTRLVKTTGGLKTTENKQTVLALVGCTGVGKTTTVAKLASEQVLRYKRKTALITLDTFRIGALEQLKAYARIMNLPLTVVGDRTAFHEALDAAREYDVILIDTAGRSQNDVAQMEELKRLFQENQRVEICLVLSATTKDAELTDTTRKFGCLPPHSVLFTKLDECLHCGALFNHIIRFKLPLHYLTTGQRVPEDMEVATPERLVDLLLQISSES